MNYLNSQIAQMKHQELHNFYGNAIAACFSPFLILKDISDRRRATVYGVTEVQLIAGIAVLAIFKSLGIG